MRLFFIVFGIFLISFAKVSTFTCSRVDAIQGYCKLVKTGFLWSEEKEIPVNKLQGAKFIDSKNSQSQVVIKTSNGEVLFSNFTTYNDEAKQQAIASQINNFVKKRDQTYLQVEDSDRWWIWVGLLSLAVGIIPLIKPK